MKKETLERIAENLNAVFYDIMTGENETIKEDASKMFSSLSPYSSSPMCITLIDEYLKENDYEFTVREVIKMLYEDFTF